MISREIINILSEAIKLRKSVVLKYDTPGDNAKGERIGYPHALYVHTSTNNILFDLFQIQGDSSNPLVAGGNWREFDVKYVTSIRIKGDIFNVQNGYKSNSPRYRRAIIKIEDVV